MFVGIDIKAKVIGATTYDGQFMGYDEYSPRG